MTSLNISLPQSMRTWVDEQVEAGGYGTASEFVRELIREAKQARAKRDLERKLIEGLESGPAKSLTKADWDSLKRKAMRRAARGKTR